MPRNLKDIIKEAVGKSLDAYNKKFGKQIHDRIDNIVAQAGTDNTEIVDARMDSSGKKHSTLNNRIVNEFKMSKEHLQEVKGEYVIVEGSVPSTIQDIELYGNTVQGTNLVDIKSCGIDNGDGTYKMSILSCGENLNNSINEKGGINGGDGTVNNGLINTFIRSKDFIRVNSNTPIIMSTGGYPAIFEYDKDYKFIKFTSDHKITTSANTKYIKYHLEKTDVNIQVKLQEGTVATPYTPYQETRCDIKLPCQLEKWDKLYFDKEENAWVVDKWTLEYSPRNQHYTINALNNVYRCFPSNATLENAEYKNDYGKTTTICKGLPFIQDNYFARDEEHYYIDPNAKKEYLFFNKNKFDGTSDGLNKYFESIDFYMLIKLASPQRIVLPQSEQMKLNSFANKTHIYTISGEVDATVKATVSKSLSATVSNQGKEIDNINNKIKDIDELKESQEYSYKSDTGVILAKQTKRGSLKNLKISGKTLVNLNQGKTDLWSSGFQDNVFTTKTDTTKYYSPCEPNEKYTIVRYDNSDRFIVKSCSEFKEGVIAKALVQNLESGMQVEKITTPSDANFLWVYVNQSIADMRVAVFKGHIENIPPYFKGVCSASNPKGLEILTRKEDANLFDGEFLDGLYNTSTGVFTQNDTVKCNKNKIPIFDSREVRISQPLTGGSYRVFYYDSNGNYIESQLITSPYVFTPNVNARYINFQIANTHYKEGITISHVDSNSLGFYQDTKPVLFKNEFGEWTPVIWLKGVSQKYCDTIEEHEDGKLYYHIRTGVFTLDSIGKVTSITSATLTRFSCSVDDMKVFGTAYVANADILCNRLSLVSFGEMYSNNKEGISLYDNKVVIGITGVSTKEQLSEKISEWNLDGSPLSVVYPLKDEIVYPCNNIILDAYNGETSITSNTSIISPTLECKLTSNINGMIEDMDVNIDILNNDLQDIKTTLGKLQSDREQSFETENGYLVCEGTEDGVVKDLKISGRSLVNLCGKLQLSTDSSKVMAITDKSLKYMQNGKLITLINNTGKKVVYDIFANETDKWVRSEIIRVGEQNKTLKLGASEYVGVVWGNKTEGWTDSDTTILKNTCILLEGDFTQNPPHYFEGIASVGNGNEIEVISNNANLFNYKDFNFTDRIKLVNDSIEINNSGSSTSTYLRKVISIPPNKEIYIKANFNVLDSKVSLRGSSEIDAVHEIDNFFIHKDKPKMKFTSPSNGKINLGYFADPNGQGSISDIMLSFDDMNYIPFKQDKKPILFKDADGAWKPVTELRGIDLNNCDILDSTVNKLYQKYDKITLNGSENIVTFGTVANNDTIAFAINDIIDSTTNPNKPNGNFVSDKLNFKDVYANNVNTDGMNIHLKSIRISVMKSKLETQDVAGFKKWLQSNPITIIYQLAQEKVYEVNPLDLESFENETMILIDGGVITPHAEWKIISSITKVLKNIGNRVSRIEKDYFEAVTIMFKSMLNGNLDQVAYMLYPDDFNHSISVVPLVPSDSTEVTQ